MDVRVIARGDSVEVDTAVVLPLFDDESPDSTGILTDRQNEDLASVFRRGGKPHRLYETTLLFGGGSGPDVLVVGAGSRGEMDALTAKRVAAAASRYLVGRGYCRFAFTDSEAVEAFPFAVAVVDGLVTGAYDVGVRKSGERTRRSVESVTLLASSDREAEMRQGADVGRVVAESRDIARDLVSRPPNEMTPPVLAERAREICEAHDLRYEVLDQDAMRELGMGSLLGVAAGSRQPPQLIVMRYGPRDASVRLALVGKGLTFDSGGLSLKTHEGMETMKTDMSGAAAVIAGMAAVAQLAPENIAVTGYVGATENMPDGNAMRPGDVLTAMNGKTIEVLNTDAEGRLVLADVLAYAVREGSTHIVDFATLTGAATVSLGNAASLATGRPMDWVNEVVESADNGLDRAWPMPQYREYRQAMDSEVADLKNTGGRGGGALNAAAFLSEFVGDVPWTHLDIAGTAFSRESRPYAPSGPTGVGVGVIAALVRALAERE